MPKNKKIKIGVLMGGPSTEREVSFVTGKAVCDNLDKNKYQIFPIEMSKSGEFFLLKNEKKELFDIFKNKKKFDIIFIAMHGAYGEDGCAQGMLQTLGIRYTGSGVLASAVGMDKIKSNELYKIGGLSVPKFIYFNKNEWKKSKDETLEKIKIKIGMPVVIKPVDQGSSVGVFIIKEEKEIKKAVEAAFKYSNFIMAQAFVKGEEATCGVLESGGEPFALPPTRIKANIGEFYDYKSKYKTGGSTHICPADFSSEINKKIQEMAVKAHKILGCRGMSRTDFIVSEDEKIYVLETNTIPGMTPMSLLPEAAGKAGIGFTEMLNLIVKASL
ncbi:MAG: D-alanine--D-alanine ligase [Patescibacteria group bacterium]